MADKPETVAVPPPSHVRSFTYNHADSTLTVRFRTVNDNHPYVHTDVPPEVFHAWRQWSKAGYSPGKFYHSHIKRYPLKADQHYGPAT